MAMDITTFVIYTRGSSLIDGDYAAYRRQLSKKLLNCRKKLNITTKNRGKFHPKPAPTAEQLASNNGYIHLQLLTAERAWAHAMTMKTAHTANKKGITGTTRSHIISRLEKAAKIAESLAESLSETDTTHATVIDVLDAHAYAATLRGAVLLEKQSWNDCLGSYSTARVIYAALATSSKSDAYKDLLADTVDQSIRFAAYQLKVPRTLSIPAIARRAFPKDDGELVNRINEIDPTALAAEQDASKGVVDTDGTIKTLTWRSREVKIEDAAISAAWTSVQEAKTKLAGTLSSSWADLLPKDRAAAYDDILIFSQDAVDATKQAIDELKSEGVSQSDSRMQGLYVTRTAVTFEMISWRIGRNRVLSGDHDGAMMDSAPDTKRRQKKVAGNQKPKEESLAKQLTRLREKVALYDSTLQSLETVKELPGIASDEGLSSQLDATCEYFVSLKALAISRSHSLTGGAINALALIKHAFAKSDKFTKILKGLASTPPSMEVGAEDAEFLHLLLQGELARCLALVRLDQLTKEKREGKSPVPLIDRLHEYPAQGVDLNNLVTYPPKLEPVPVKPLFFDVAWNHIDYPSDKPKMATSKVPGTNEESAKPQKKGWFGFGR